MKGHETMEIRKMGFEDIKKRRSQLPSATEIRNYKPSEVESFIKELEALEAREQELKASVEERNKRLEKVLNAKPHEIKVLEERNADHNKIKGKDNMEKLEIRSLQKFLAKTDLTHEERNTLVLDGAGAVLPQEIADKLLTDEKYSTLLSRATQFNERGNLSVPIASGNSASWKAEGATLTPSNATLGSLKLGGYELMHLMSISSAVQSMSAGHFENLITKLLSDETVETLEETFIKGTGTGQPKGLDNEDLTANTVEATDEIKASDVAKAIGKLKQKYGKNAIIMANTSTLLDLVLDTSEKDGTVGLGTDTFLRKQLVPNEHISDNVVYVVDPSELYVKWAMPITLEADRSSSFRSANIDIRALAVVDAKWNTNAVAKVVIA